ncbi:MAG: hypothetical protein AB7P12_15495 [Alphaproteobacteria bacterium]
MRWSFCGGIECYAKIFILSLAKDALHKRLSVQPSSFARLRMKNSVGHVGIAMALAPAFDGRAPVAKDAVEFLRRY